ncbi:MAG: hypothetical protein U0X87_11405 [Anaerolineales bacterium]
MAEERGLADEKAKAERKEHRALQKAKEEKRLADEKAKAEFVKRA